MPFAKRRLPVIQPSTTVPYVFSTFEDALARISQSQIGVASILGGTERCNASCQFCVSKTTVNYGVSSMRPHIDRTRLHRFMEYVKAGNTSTVMITGKGEPLLEADQVTQLLTFVMEEEHALDFALIGKEIQTNGILIDQAPRRFEPLLSTWRDLGLTTIAVSIVHYDTRVNHRVYLPQKESYINLSRLIDRIHTERIRVRLATIMFNGGIDTVKKLQHLMKYARKNKVEELTLRPVNKPLISQDSLVGSWIEKNHLRQQNQRDIEDFLWSSGRLVGKLPHGAYIFDIDGQNVCLTNSLTLQSNPAYYRQIIFYPESGDILTDWVDGKRLP